MAQSVTIKTVTFGTPTNPDAIVLVYDGGSGNQSLEWPDKAAMYAYAQENVPVANAASVLSLVILREHDRDESMPQLDTLAGKTSTMLDPVLQIA